MSIEENFSKKRTQIRQQIRYAILKELKFPCEIDLLKQRFNESWLIFHETIQNNSELFKNEDDWLFSYMTRLLSKFCQKDEIPIFQEYLKTKYKKPHINLELKYLRKHQLEKFISHDSCESLSLIKKKSKRENQKEVSKKPRLILHVQNNVFDHAIIFNNQLFLKEGLLICKK